MEQQWSRGSFVVVRECVYEGKSLREATELKVSKEETEQEKKKNPKKVRMRRSVVLFRGAEERLWNRRQSQGGLRIAPGPQDGTASEAHSPPSWFRPLTNN